MTNNQQLNSLLVLAGVKSGNHAMLAAISEFNNAALHAIISGNIRPFEDTKAALSKGVTKSGEFAQNAQGIVLAGLINGAKSSRVYYEELHANNGKFNKTLTANDKALANQYALAVSEEFKSFVETGLKTLADNRKAASDKTKATKDAAALEAKTKEAVNTEKLQAIESEKAANTFTLDALVKAIKGGNEEALSIAEVIKAALQAHELQALNKAAALAKQAAKVESIKQAA